MVRRSIGTSIVVALVTVLGASAPVSAFSIFGFNFGSTQPAASEQTQAATDPQQEVDNFLNDIIANTDVNTCLQFTNHEYEVCTAYIFNSAMADLVPYYKFANSTNTSLARFVSYRLDSRYSGPANSLIRDRVVGWPTGEFDVDVPSIKILSINSSLANNSATLQTIETWRVADDSGNTMYAETNAYHTITMARVQSYVLHKWVVTSMQ